MTRGGPAGVRAAALALGVAAAGAVGCVSPPQDPPPVNPLEDFVPFARDFAGFRSWPHRTIESAEASGVTHVSGRRTVYVNHEAEPGATSFPVGTLMVKETEADGKLFARAKRGEGFNATGAKGWEWFELAESATGAVAIQWRGLGPPLGEKYGGDPNSGCNPCHKTATATDYVMTPGLLALSLPDAGAEPDASSDSNSETTSPDATLDLDPTHE